MRRFLTIAALPVASALVSGSLLSGAQAPVPAASPGPRPAGTEVRLDRAEAERLAKDARAKVQVEMPAGVEISLWASERLIVDPVALDVDPRGIAYVASTARNNLPLDIRGHQDWMAVVHTLKTTDDLRAFYRTRMAPERSAENGWIQDLNGDGSRDIRDLAEMKERIFRIQDTDGDGVADTSRVVFEGFDADPSWDVVGGILKEDDALIVGVPPGVYRLRDTKGDGTFGERRTISDGYNVHPAFGGHGISGVTIGPDGRLYWEVGDMGLHVVDQTGRAWAYPNQGAVMRSELDGSGFEVFAAGIRNLQEFSFDEHGNLISVDNDGDHPGETERLVYLPYGSDSGWRSNWQYGKYTDEKNNRYNVWMQEGMFKPRHEGQTAHILPPLAPWHAGPSGMAYNPGTALSDDWRGHFFVTSFPGAPANARIYAFTLKEDGAGFTMDREQVLLRGILSVGLKIGPDGALYVTDWITGWDSKNNGRLWKLDTPASAGSPVRKEVQALLAERFASRSPADLATLLAHADMRVRQKAQFDLVRRGDAQTLLGVAQDPSKPLARLHAIWGVAQLARKAPRQASALLAFLADADPEVRAQAAKMVGDVRYEEGGDRLVPLLSDAAPRVRFFAAEALGRLAHKPAVAPLIAMLAANEGRDVHLQFAGAAALASIGDAGSLEALASNPSRVVRTAAVVALKRMHHAGVGRFLADEDEQIATDAARAINDDGGIDGAVAQLAGLLGTTRFANEPLLRRTINANLRVGTNEALARLVAFASDASRPEDLRVEAIGALGVWPAPSPMDRVDGFYHAAIDAALTRRSTGPRQGRNAEAARDAVERLFKLTAKEAQPASSATKVALADAAGRLQLTSAAPVLLAQLRADPAQAVRLTSLQALRAINAPGMDEVMQVALADKEPAVRRAALGILPTLSSMSAAAKAQHLATLVESGSLPEKQGAIEVLGQLKSAESRRLLGQYLDSLSKGTLAPELRIDLLGAVQTDGSAPLAARLAEYQKSQKADTLAAAFREGLLEGGDARRGRQVAMENPAAECSRCHAIRGRGADVGPDLSRIGSALSREQLLQSLVEPNARIAPGFGTVGIVLKNGQHVDGTLRDETESELVVLTGTPAVERRLPKTDIAERTDPVSAMPPLGLVLQPREVRDLVEYLTTLR